MIPQFSGEVRQGDLRDENYLDRMLVGIDIICHAAGWSSFEKSGDIANKAYLEPTLDLIQHAIEWRVSRFINLSSIYAAPAKHRNDANAKGRPHASWPMMNCHIAVEDYLRNLHEPRCQFINLRLGLYSGKRLNMGLLALLLNRSNTAMLPYLSGALGYFPLVDGKDIGQAFARAALGPFELSYNSLNIVGPENISHAEAMKFIKQSIQACPLSPGLPSMIASPILWIQGKTRTHNEQPLFTPPMIEMLKSPIIDNALASHQIGYDPEISWKASLLNTLEGHKNQTLSEDITQNNKALDL